MPGAALHAPSAPPAGPSSPDALRYRSVTLPLLLRHGSPTEKRWILGCWLASLLASVGLGLATVVYQWSGIALPFAGVQVYLTIYPPLIICLWWTLSFGWAWGAVPGYVATLTLALYAGMPTPWALLFAFANPLGFAVMSQSYRAVAVPLHMRSVHSVVFYILIAFVGAVFSSAGALIWIHTNRIDTVASLPIWQGWWLGGFLQSVLIVGPLLAVSWPRLARWQAQHPEYFQPESTDRKRRNLRLMLLITLGVLGYGMTTVWLGTNAVRQALGAGDSGKFLEATQTLVATTWAFYWVSAVVIVFVGFFGYRVFTYWIDSNDLLLQQVARTHAELRLASRTDMLTNLLNRRAMEEALQQQTQRCMRFAEPTALVMLDIDHFKAINDSHGHDVGDTVIRRVAQTITASIRTIDVSARWGGEEFLLILPNVDVAGATTLADRIREAIAGQTVPTEGAAALQFTVSLGIAMFHPKHPDHETWIKHADQALYAAKHGGRNRTAVWQEAVLAF
ncbi:GGDEF domain-containing protein [Rhodoferax sp. AJA081-3]|uniref:GGDEF domain-containing protein n=1 Tax=Rhodoferax sp. AJA081-3 TaxID=2752316 RepID=UPI001AE00160|nr:GGDEF domain-containing protein [Rhodoferax sp. AJA081-3]QTN27783.1 GGDEF domain-containing protein [Rhodoferax sp. AJA081-3]